MLLVPIVIAAPVQELAITLDTSTDNFTVQSIDLSMRDYSRFWSQRYGDYVWTVSDGKNVLNISFFDVEGTLFYDSINPVTGEIDSGGSEPYRAESVDLAIPYYPEAKRFTIFKVHNQSTMNISAILSIDLSTYIVEYSFDEEDNGTTLVENAVLTEQQEKAVQDNLQQERTRKQSFVMIALFAVLVVIISLILSRQRQD